MEKNIYNLDELHNIELLETKLDEDGKKIANFKLSSPGGTPAIIYTEPALAIPVVFIPGIMGSPLISKKASEVSALGYKWAWFPDSLKWIGGTMPRAIGLWPFGFSNLSPKSKERMLRVENTRIPLPSEADFLGVEDLSYDTKKFIYDNLSEYKRRGWGSVVLGDNGYGDILVYLEKTLNSVYLHGSISDEWKGIKDEIRKFLNEDNNFIQHYEKNKKYFSVEEIENMGCRRFPVYAAGYNWLESNEVSAKKIASEIECILDDCKNRLSLKCEKVILVTHSMGGLVGRMCAKKYSEKIMGVVHGVQPINGAGSAYHRVVAGWDFDGGAGWVIGDGAEHLTPIFANPGPLQLLPNKLYGRNWLNIKRVGGVNRTVLSLPKKNPYKEIYMNTSSWWRVVDIDLIKPGGDRKVSEAFYSNNISEAELFHDDIEGYFHKETYVHYGKGSGKNKTWYSIDIQVQSYFWGDDYSDDDLINSKMISRYGFSSNSAIISKSSLADWLADCREVTLSEKDDKGDGTVPVSSMHLDEHSNVKAFTVIQDIGHASEYNYKNSRVVALYGICKIVNSYDKGEA